MKLAMIRRGDVVRFIHQREADVTSGTVIKEVNVLKRMLNVAVDREMIGANPAQRAPMPKAPEGRTRFLTPEEWTRVFAARRIPPDIYGKEQEQWLQQAAGLVISLGVRRGELLSITVPDVDLQRRQVALKKTKNGKPRTVYINDLALAVFESMGLGERKRGQDRGVLFPPSLPSGCRCASCAPATRRGWRISSGMTSGIRSPRTSAWREHPFDKVRSRCVAVLLKPENANNFLLS
jgi:integrase